MGTRLCHSAHYSRLKEGVKCLLDIKFEYDKLGPPFLVFFTESGKNVMHFGTLPPMDKSVLGWWNDLLRVGKKVEEKKPSYIELLKLGNKRNRAEVIELMGSKFFGEKGDNSGFSRYRGGCEAEKRDRWQCFGNGKR